MNLRDKSMAPLPQLAIDGEREAFEHRQFARRPHSLGGNDPGGAERVARGGHGLAPRQDDGGKTLQDMGGEKIRRLRQGCGQMLAHCGTVRGDRRDGGGVMGQGSRGNRRVLTQ